MFNFFLQLKMRWDKQLKKGNVDRVFCEIADFKFSQLCYDTRFIFVPSFTPSLKQIKF